MAKPERHRRPTGRDQRRKRERGELRAERRSLVEVGMVMGEVMVVVILVEVEEMEKVGDVGGDGVVVV